MNCICKTIRSIIFSNTNIIGSWFSWLAQRVYLINNYCSNIIKLLTKAIQLVSRSTLLTALCPDYSASFLLFASKLTSLLKHSKCFHNSSGSRNSNASGDPQHMEKKTIMNFDS